MPALRQAAAVNPGDKFELVFKSLLENLFVERMDQNEEIFVRFMNDTPFQKLVTAWMASEAYRRLRSDDTSRRGGACGKRIRTINGLERLNREIRRRTRVVGIFPHEASALRLISAVLAEIHEEWLTGRQYLNLAGWKKQVEQSFPTGPQGNYRKTVA